MIYCRNEQTDTVFSFDWINEFSSERSLKLPNGQDAQFVVRIFNKNNFKLKLFFCFIKVFKDLPDVYLENTDQFGSGCFSLYIYPAIHFTNLLPVDIQCSFDVSQRIFSENSYHKMT